MKKVKLFQKNVLPKGQFRIGDLNSYRRIGEILEELGRKRKPPIHKNVKVTILNTSILTNFGEYNYSKISVTEAKSMIKGGFESAIGHQSTCDVLKTILGRDIKMNRVQYSQQVGDSCLVFKLKGRPEEGKILTADELNKIGFYFGKLNRIA